MLQNLPIQLVPMVGRDKERTEIRNLLEDPQNRLVTLHGFGGTGKTRLAVEVGRMVADRFADGVWFVALTPLESPDQMVTATALALGFNFGSTQDQKEQLFNYLKNKDLLLILDNLEHLLPQATVFLDELLENVPRITLLVTSRIPLNTPWEWSFPLRGLEYQDGQPELAGKLSDSAELFLQQLRRTGHPVRAEDSACASHISRLVNGLPLALLLAASWGRTLGCDEIYEEIKKGIGFLKSHKGTFPEKHNSMQAVFDSALRLLSENEQAVLRKLSVFRGGFDRAAVLAVTGADLSLIASLVDQALIERYTTDRYQIHELLRQYLQERLTEANDETAAREAHLVYFSGLVQEIEPALFGEQQVAEFNRVRTEIDNLLAALDWCLKKPEPARMETGMLLLVATERLWILSHFAKTGLAFVVRLLKNFPAEQFPRTFGRGNYLAGRLSFAVGDLPETRRYAAQTLLLGQQLKDDRIIGDAYLLQSIETFHRGEYKDSRACVEKALATYQHAHYLPGEAQALYIQGRCEIIDNNYSLAGKNLKAALELTEKLGDLRTRYSILRGLGELATANSQLGLDQARAYYQQGLELARLFNDNMYTSVVLNGLGEIARLEGLLDQAIGYFEESISICNYAGRADDVTTSELNLGFVYSRQGKKEQSIKIFLKYLSLNSTKVPNDIATCQLGLIGAVVTEGEAPLAAKILGTLEPWREHFLSWPTDRSEYMRIRSAAEAQLSESQFARYFKEGQSLSLEQGTQLIQASPVLQGMPARGGRSYGLTAREVEVLRQVSFGLSDQEVAERLVISPRTVNAHLTSIYNKLGVDSRAAATLFSREKGLV